MVDKDSSKSSFASIKNGIKSVVSFLNKDISPKKNKSKLHIANEELTNSVSKSAVNNSFESEDSLADMGSDNISSSKKKKGLFASVTKLLTKKITTTKQTATMSPVDVGGSVEKKSKTAFSERLKNLLSVDIFSKKTKAKDPVESSTEPVETSISQSDLEEELNDDAFKKNPFDEVVLKAQDEDKEKLANIESKSDENAAIPEPESLVDDTTRPDIDSFQTEELEGSEVQEERGDSSMLDSDESFELPEDVESHIETPDQESVQLEVSPESQDQLTPAVAVERKDVPISQLSQSIIRPDSVLSYLDSQVVDTRVRKEDSSSFSKTFYRKAKGSRVVVPKHYD